MWTDSQPKKMNRWRTRHKEMLYVISHWPREKWEWTPQCTSARMTRIGKDWPWPWQGLVERWRNWNFHAVGVKRALTSWARHRTPGCLPRREENVCHTETYPQMFTAALLVTDRNWKQCKWPSTSHQQTNCDTLILMAYYSANKKKWTVYISNNMFKSQNNYAERSQAKEYIQCDSTWTSRIRELNYSDTNQNGVCLGKGDIHEGVTVNDQEDTFGDNGPVHCLNCGNGFMGACICRSLQNCML